ncbi:MAG TPA: biotin-dependent carboxyltransferase family protein, partial [Chitinophagaceae bacterium]|nr:biotin-dependent carboxyltransferase family protein [Chitinophagaceae bacterium]
FEKSCIICLTGADFRPVMNDKPIPLCQPLLVKEGALLQFRALRKGARCYLSLWNELSLQQWLRSYSTNVKAGAGGYKGRRLQNGDQLGFAVLSLPAVTNEVFTPLPWRYLDTNVYKNEVAFIPGHEWGWLTTKSQTHLLNNTFTVSTASDRMGYRLQGTALEQQHREQVISSAVGFGTVQLLPNGQLIILMADHQTTGGYPRIGHVISADLPKLAQMQPGEDVRFEMTNHAIAEAGWIERQHYLMRLQNSCNLEMQNWVNADRH